MARILIIDDDSSIRELLTFVLDGQGHEVVSVDGARTAMESQHTAPADLVITDLVMPGQNGVDTIREMREAFPTLKILAMSGQPDSRPGSGLYSATQAGANRTFAKPFDVSEISAVVKEVLEETTAPAST